MLLFMCFYTPAQVDSYPQNKLVNVCMSFPQDHNSSSTHCGETFADCSQCFDNIPLPGTLGSGSMVTWRTPSLVVALSCLQRGRNRRGEERRVLDFFLPDKAKSAEDGKESTATSGQRQRYR